MNNYDIFRKKSNSIKCSTRVKSNLITNAAGTTKVLHRRVNKDIEVNLVITNKTEGRGTAKVYSWVADDLKVGDYFVWKNNVFLVTEQENNVLLDEDIHKFDARECNVQVYQEGSESGSKVSYWFDAVFIGSATQKIDTSLKTSDNSNALLSIGGKDLIIFSGFNSKKLKRIMINNQQWDILDWDDTTAAPIIYATIDQTPVTIVQQEEPEKPTEQVYRAGLSYTFKTENYYYTSDYSLKCDRQKDKVIITLPYDIPTIVFNTKVDGAIVTNTININ